MRRAISTIRPGNTQRVSQAKGFGTVVAIAGAVLVFAGADVHFVIGAVAALMVAGGIAIHFVRTPLPTSAVLRLAEECHGVVTLSEIATAVDIDPAVALRTLEHLQKLGIATQRWAELPRNVWEFPDYIRVPISRTLDLARKNGGRVSLGDLVASGQSLEMANQTLDVLSQRGLGRQDPEAGDRTLIVASEQPVAS